MKGFLISAPASGSGKTLVTLGLSRALRRRGMAVQCFKSGPDYIDPAFHRAATGRASFNLDTWAMGEDLIRAILSQAEGADVVVAEGSILYQYQEEEHLLTAGQNLVIPLNGSYFSRRETPADFTRSFFSSRGQISLPSRNA